MSSAVWCSATSRSDQNTLVTDDSAPSSPPLPMDDATAAQPGIRRLFRRLTLMWGLVVVAKASVTLWLLESQSTVDFVLIKNAVVIALTLLAVAATVAMSIAVGRREGLLPVRPAAV